MAFNKRFFDPTSSGSKGTAVMGYYQTTDNKAAVKGAGYFNDVADEMASCRVGALLIFASDATFMAKVAVASGVVTLSALDDFA